MLLVVVTTLVAVPAIFGTNLPEKGTYIYYSVGAAVFQLMDAGFLLFLSYMLISRLFPNFFVTATQADGRDSARAGEGRKRYKEPIFYRN